MKNILISFSILLGLLMSGCAKRTVYSNIKDAPINEKNMAIIQDDYFHYPWAVNVISKLNKSTGKFEEIYNYANKKPGHVYKKYVLLPGTYKITYSRKFRKTPLTKYTSKVELKAGHKYRVNFATCKNLYLIHKRICRAYTATSWFEDLTTGEVLGGYKWEHLPGANMEGYPDGISYKKEVNRNE